MSKNYRLLLLVIALLLIIGVGLYIRSYYMRTEGKYLLVVDPYYHYRMAETILEQGSRPEIDLMAAYPTGAPVNHPPLFHYYLAYSYKIVDLFSSMTLFQWCLYANILPIILTIIVAFLTGRALTNDVGGIFTALFTAVNTAIVMRTVIAYTDTDIWIVLFSLTICFFFFSAIKDEKKMKWAVPLGFTLFLFALTWRGHWHVPLLLFASFLLYLLFGALKKTLDRGILAAFTASFLVFLLLFSLYEGMYVISALFMICGVVWILGDRLGTPSLNPRVLPVIWGLIIILSTYILYQQGVFHIIFSAVTTIGGSSSQGAIMLPDISISIMQRFEITLSRMIDYFGVLLFIAPFGLILLLWKRDQYSLRVLDYLLLYMAGTVVLMTEGGRYTLLFAIPLILATGIFYGIIPEILRDRVTQRGILAVLMACSLAVIPTYMTAEKASHSESVMTDDLYTILTWMSENTPEDAVILGGWDMGYWIESIAKRRSVMNGGHYDIQWRVVKFGKIVETTSEDVAIKEIYGFPDEAEVKALRNFPEDGQWAIQKEMQGFAQDNVYMLVSDWSMLTFYWLSYFGNWDYVSGEGKGRQYIPLLAEGAKKLLSGTEYAYVGTNMRVSVIKEREKGYFHSYILDQGNHIPTLGTIFFIGETEMILERPEGQGGFVYVPPQNLPFYVSEVEWEEMGTVVFYIKQEDQDCMLTRLYFFNGEGLHYFELIKDVGTAKLYKIHTIPQEFDQGIYRAPDTYTPI
ncbi:MAG: hypothetical protein HXS53_04345 [Theionarchaea archaeon]|nr:hypothetical protein [Theionarchaea archaeon]